jgi:hypothetical protein
MYTFYFYVHPTNSLNSFASFTLFAACKMFYSVGGGVEGKQRILCGGLLQVNKRMSFMLI